MPRLQIAQLVRVDIINQMVEEAIVYSVMEKQQPQVVSHVRFWLKETCAQL